MKNIEKLMLLSFLYETTEDAQKMNSVYSKCVNENEKIALLCNYLENEIYLGEKGKKLLEKGKSIYEELLQNPAKIKELTSMINGFLYDVQGGRLTSEKLTCSLAVNSSEYSCVEKEFYPIAVEFFKTYYKGMIRTLLIFNGKNGLKSVVKCNSEDLYDWLLYFQSCNASGCVSSDNVYTWTIQVHHSGRKDNLYDDGYYIKYYSGVKKFNELLNQEDVVKYDSYLAGCVNEIKDVKLFGIGNIVNVTSSFWDDISSANIFYHLPETGKISNQGFSSNPFKTINYFLGSEDVNYCISPEEYLGLCRAYSAYFFKKNGNPNICLVCGATLNEGLTMCPKHCGRV